MLCYEVAIRNGSKCYDRPESAGPRLIEPAALSRDVSLRINESLDFDTVLQGVLDSARSLTGARYGAMTLLKDGVEIPPDWEPPANPPGTNAPLVDYFTSGLTEEQVGAMQDMPERVLLFDYLRRIPGTLRIPDLAGHTMSLGMADRLRMVQVLGNLLTNAARHSPESSVIRVTAVREEVHVAVSVSDLGRGILAESLPHLFRKFSRIESQEQGGDTGLGLAICKGIVEALGGRIWAESDGPGLGARFTFTLPTVEAAGYVSPAGHAHPSTRSSRRGSADQVRIVAVDDDPQALRYVRDTLDLPPSNLIRLECY